MDPSPPSPSFSFWKGPKEFQSKHRRWFPWTARICAAGLAWFFLSITSLQYKPNTVPLLHLGARSDQYVVSQVSFQYVDQEKTSVRYKEAESHIGNIYLLSPIFLGHVEEEWFAKEPTSPSKRLQHNPDLRKLQKQAQEQISDLLHQALFTDRGTIRLVEHILDSPSFDQNTFLGKNILASYQNFYSIDQEGQVPDLLQERIVSILGSKESQPLLNILKKALRTNPEGSDVFVPQHVEQTNLKAALREVMPPWKENIREGTLLLAKGATITEKELDLIQSMYVAMQKQPDKGPMVLMGQSLLALLYVVAITGALQMVDFRFLRSTKHCFLFVFFLCSSWLWMLFISSSWIEWITYLHDFSRFPLVLSLPSILSGLLFSFPVAFLSSGVLLILSILSFQGIDLPYFVGINFASSAICLVKARKSTSRRDLFAICIKTWFLGCLPFLISRMILRQLPWEVVVNDALANFGVLFLSAILANGLLPLFEAAFHTVTDITLTEFTNPTHTLLKRLSIEAPGTYQHTLAVTSMAEVSASAIGANVTLCKVAAMYHDIGKLGNPSVYIENQPDSINIHTLLTPTESARAIRNHVEEGVRLAREHGIPWPVIEIIREHHGTTKISFFRQQHVENVGEISQEEEKEFCYPGPKPRSKESSIIMIVDALEALVRAVSPDRDQIKTMIKEVIHSRISQGQLDECPLSFKEVKYIEEALTKFLLFRKHKRIPYPKGKDHEEGKKGSTEGGNPKGENKTEQGPDPSFLT